MSNLKLVERQYVISSDSFEMIDTKLQAVDSLLVILSAALENNEAPPSQATLASGIQGLNILTEDALALLKAGRMV